MTAAVESDPAITLENVHAVTALVDEVHVSALGLWISRGGVAVMLHERAYQGGTAGSFIWT